MIKSRLTAVLVVAAVLTTMTIAVAVPATNVQATSGGGNSGNVEDNGNAGVGGMGNCDSGDDCEPQPDRVGNDDDTDTDADRDGPGGADESPTTDEDEGEANCWGKVSSALGKQQNEIDGPAHSANPVPNDEDNTDNETPREGVGNQAEGHPSDHADTVGGFSGIDEDCVD